MSRWKIEKDGTGIEKSGTGIEKSGTGIEKSGTGIEKSGTGIEKSGTGIRRALLACSLAAITFAGNIQASGISPAGSLQLVVQNNTVAASWIIGDSVFSGVSKLNGSFASLMLTEVTLSKRTQGTDIAGSGSGNAIQIAGSGSGSSVKIAGSGSGSSIQIAGSGSGSAINIAGSGSGSAINIAGSGSGSAVNIAGSGSGSAVNIAGSGSGSAVNIAGSGSGSQLLIAGSGSGSSIAITLPHGTGMAMEITMGCGSAKVAVNDSNSIEVVSFDNVKVMGKSGFCGRSGIGAGNGFGRDFIVNPGKDFHLN